MSLKKISIVILFFSLIFLIRTETIADDKELVKPDVWGADKTISTGTPYYTGVDQIHIVEIPLTKGYVFENEDILTRTIYYHYVFRLGYPEPIFNILIAPSGKTYELTINGVDSQVPHDKSKGIIVIGVVTNETTSLDKNREQVINQVLRTASIFELTEKDVFASEIKLNYSKPPTVSFLPTDDEELVHLVENVKNSIKGQIKTVTPQIEISSNTFSVEADPEQLAEVSITLTNKSENALYGGKTKTIYVGTIEPKDRRSSCFDSTTWPTPSRTGELSPTRISSNGTGTIKFKCKARLMPGEYHERFALVTKQGQWLDNTAFTLNIKVKDIGQKVLQIKETGVGYLNVRQTPSPSAPIIATVGVGEQFLFYEYNNGFYKIKFDDNYGWISARHVNILKN